MSSTEATDESPFSKEKPIGLFFCPLSGSVAKRPIGAFMPTASCPITFISSLKHLVGILWLE